MWGSENWGEMVWSGGIVSPIPALEPAALVLLAAVLVIGAVVIVRRVRPAR